MCSCRRWQPSIDSVEVFSGAHGRECRCEMTSRRRCIVHVVGDNGGNVVLLGQGDESVVTFTVERHAVVPQLDEHVCVAECVDQFLQFAFGVTVTSQRMRHDTLATTGEHSPITVVCSSQLIE